MTSIQKNVQQAKATGDDKRYGQVASRKKVSSRQIQSTHIHPTCYPNENYYCYIETRKNGYGTS